MLIGISGKLGSGKDTVGQMIQAEARGYWEIKKYAKKLKQITCILTGCSMQELESQEFKDSLLSPEWKGGHCTFSHSTYRDMLQKLGTEVMRDSLHSNVWVNALMADYQFAPNKSMDECFKEQFLTGRSEIHYKFPKWIITDMRFPNELEAVKERGGITIRVNRDNGTRAISMINSHTSETALDDANFDYVIENDGNLSELKASVVEFLRKTNLR